MKDHSSAKVYTAIAGIVILLIVNALMINYLTNPLNGSNGVDMDNLARYTVSKTNLMYDEIPAESVSEGDAAASSEGKLLYPDFPYFIEVDKTNQVITVFTTSSSGRYDKPVRVMLCSTAQNPKAFPSGYWKLKADRATSKYVWRTMMSYGTPLYAQYVTQMTGHFFFHSVPYSDTKKDALDQKRFAALGTPDPGGCIRLTVENAKWISENCKEGTTVHITENKKICRSRRH